MPDLIDRFPTAGRRCKKPAGETPLEAPNSINSNPFPTSDAVSEEAPQFSFPPASQAKGTDSKFSYPASPAAAQAATEEALQSFAPATLADAPSSEDELGFSPYTRALAQFLLNIDTKGPLSVSIEGQWGSGKSSFLLILENDLKKGSAEK